MLFRAAIWLLIKRVFDTFSLLEIIEYFKFNKSSVYVLMLDARKAFDRMNYRKLSAALLKRDIYLQFSKVIAF